MQGSGIRTRKKITEGSGIGIKIKYRIELEVEL